MGNRRRKRGREHRDSYGFKISELLTQLVVRTTPPNGPLPRNVSLLPSFTLPAVRETTATTRSKAQLPECITRLSDTQCRKWYHQRQATPFSASTPTLALNPRPAPNAPGHTTAPASTNISQPGRERPSLVSPDLFFLPYLAARETAKGCDSLSLVRDLFQRGEVCPDILGVKEWSSQRPAAWTNDTAVAPQRMLIEPEIIRFLQFLTRFAHTAAGILAHSSKIGSVSNTCSPHCVTSVHYFEDLRDLQRKLFKGILWTSSRGRDL
ncbi:uncharacterized protein LOC129855566 isoform X1 [Salvelinus fontinalis]|uniref:uncharacterized protein LOC129855566 isoform X1 n=1 Tax=Salvelinus fontinalis TaxID=8038 RepID=UPI002484D78B|nr:uncharacterized protein LOC129855566 isoform X1 [Salvelinus fontinalis]